MKRKISQQKRRHQDYLRRSSMKIASVYSARLQRLRAEQVRSLLKGIGDYPLDQWEGVIRSQLNEPYLGQWFNGLYVSAGLPHAKSTVRDMNKAKADTSGIWESMLSSYARERAGDMIVIVSGTFKDNLISILRSELENDDTVGIEKLTQKIYWRYRNIQEWEARRIAQTETLISTGYAGDAAARSLDVRFTKQWCVSGMLNTRDSHLAVDGEIVDEDEPFRVGNSYLMYPHDTSLSAESCEIINCACSCIRIPK